MAAEESKLRGRSSSAEGPAYRKSPEVSLWNISEDSFMTAAEADRARSLEQRREGTAGDALHTASTTSAPRGRKTGTKSTTSLHKSSTLSSTAASQAGAGSEVESVQEQLKVYIEKTMQLQVQLTELDGTISTLRKEVQEKEATRGGFRAVQENEKAVQRAEIIMEKRLASALAEYMTINAANNRLHADIDRLRHDKLAQKIASASVDKELRALQAESRETEREIHKRRVKEEEVEHEIVAVRQESDAKQLDLHSKWQEFVARGGELEVPDIAAKTPTSIPARLQEKSQGTRTVTAGTVTAPDSRGLNAAATAKEVGETVCALLGLADIDAFVARFEDEQEKNYAIFTRNDELLKEAEELRNKIADTRVHAARAHAAQEEENRERLKKLEHMHVLIAEARERLRRLTSQHTAESKCLGAVRRGLKSLLETLGEEETDPLRDGSLMSYFGVVQNLIQEVLVWCFRAQHESGRMPPVSPISTKRGSTVDIDLLATGGSFDGASSARSGQGIQPMVIDPDAVVVGPQFTTGSVTRTITSMVQPPSLDGPKDARLYSQLFASSASSGDDATRGNITLDDDDRPMSVPLGTTRNSGGIAGSSSAATLASKKSVASLPPALDSRRPTSSDVKAVPAAAPSSSATTLPSIFRQ